MKTLNAVLKVLTALATIASAVYLIAVYGDKIVAWAKRVIGCCPWDEGMKEEEAPAAAEEPAAEAPAAEEPAPAAAEEPAEEHAPAAEETPAAEEPAAEPEEPVADEGDFEG